MKQRNQRAKGTQPYGARRRTGIREVDTAEAGMDAVTGIGLSRTAPPMFSASDEVKVQTPIPSRLAFRGRTTAQFELKSSTPYLQYSTTPPLRHPVG
ncbi:MAG: hypothetical protein KAI66_02025 [Lentisphaeria bacterium]|nr:hypothetical protein [Lentisphaeria bacterium]